MPDGGETLGPYTLLRKIGAGGMGEVYLARDPRLEREVALKQLPAELHDDPERRQRFLREARAVAKLAHPNITAIHEVGEADGHDYIAFEYVEGKTLDGLVREHALSLAELIDLALPLADALAYAHERGVIHRDLKAANVMVTPRGHPKLLDFGLAKLLHAEDAERKEKTTTLTVEGAIFGTPQAMSPEQALGRPVDERSDVFSFGSLLFEMASGQPAFRGATIMEVMDNVIHADPPDLARLRPDLPVELSGIVAKAMRKDPAERYPSIAGLVADLKHFKRKTESGLVPVASQRRAALPFVALGVVLVIGLAWVLLGRGGGPQAGRDGGVDSGARSIAVIGFELVGGSAAKEAEGSLDRALTSLVTTALAESGGIEVASSSKVVASLRSVGLESGRSFDPGLATRAAEEAGVDLMVVGQVLVRSQGLVLTAELVDVASGSALDSLRREAGSEDELFALAEGLAKDVREHLGLTKDHPTTIDLGELTTSPEAYFKYVAGEMALHEARFPDAVRLFTQAIAIDPSFAMAHARLGWATEWDGRPEDALAAYEKALEHSSRLPRRWQRLVEIAADYALGAMDRAYAACAELTAQPNPLPEAFNTLGEIQVHGTRYVDPFAARAAFLRALEIDPNFQIVLYHVVGSTLEIGDTEVLEALAERLRGANVNPEGAAYVELGLLMARRDHEAAVRHIESTGREEADLEEYVWCLTALGRFDELDKLLASIRPEPGGNAWCNHKRFRAVLEGSRGNLTTALELYLEASEGMPRLPEGKTSWYAENRAGNKLEAARTAHRLERSLDEVLGLCDEAVMWDPYTLDASYYATCWLVEAGRIEEASERVERMRRVAAECPSPIASAWLVLAETELALGQDDLDRAREWLGTLDDVPRGHRPWTETEVERARVARAAGDAAAEVEAWRAALHAAREPSSAWRGDVEYDALYSLADALDRAGDSEAARAHGRELLSRWANSEDDFPMLTDARQRWGE